MGNIVNILMKRDSMTRQEALKVACDARQEVLQAIDGGADYDSVADIVRDMLGLEPDYIESMIF